MDAISQRELRNQSGAVLRRVVAGETIMVTNNGEPAALLTPVPASARGRLVDQGLLSPPRRAKDLAAIHRRQPPDARSSDDVLAEDRAER